MTLQWYIDFMDSMGNAHNLIVVSLCSIIVLEFLQAIYHRRG